MAKQTRTRGAGGRISRSETVSIRLDPRLNYLCELAARSQRRTKSSFIEAAIEEKIRSMPLENWSDPRQQDTFGDRADELWHVRECERLVSLGFIAPHLMTLEEQEIWTTIREYGYLWRGQWVNEGIVDSWNWICRPDSLLRDRLSECWGVIVKVAEGDLALADLPSYEKSRPARRDENEPNGSSSSNDIADDDDIPF